LTRQCSFIRPGGQRCNGVALRTSDLCAAHDPSTQERRRRGQAKGGKAKGGTRDEVREIRSVLRHATAQLLRPERGDEQGTGPEPRTMSRADAAVLATVCKVRLRLVEVERKLVENEDLLRRIAALEQENNAPRYYGTRFGP
jgi:hypothetical protein